MKRYNLAKISKTLTIQIPNTEYNSYREILIQEMVKLGANKNELALICDATIQNAIRNKRKPEDVAWAILQ